MVEVMAVMVILAMVEVGEAGAAVDTAAGVLAMVEVGVTMADGEDIKAAKVAGAMTGAEVMEVLGTATMENGKDQVTAAVDGITAEVEVVAAVKADGAAEAKEAVQAGIMILMAEYTAKVEDMEAGVCLGVCLGVCPGVME
jgi:hypothetical protein